MCGFAVLIGADGTLARAGSAGQTADSTALPQVPDALRRRGPDGHDTWEEPGLRMVAARLAHWQEGAAHQPYVDADSGAAAVLNGELYNLAELQARLGLPGASEVAVLVAGLRTEGMPFLRAIDGQFAAVVRTHRDGAVYAVRDRFGVCPLYYTVTDDGVVLASGLHALEAMAGERWPLSGAGLVSILQNWAPTGGLTSYHDVFQVPPAHGLRIDTAFCDPAPGGAQSGHSRTHRSRVADVVAWGHELVPSRSYDGPRDLGGGGAAAVRPPDQGPSAADPAALESALRASVRARVRSTGGVACLLSGGIDSTIIGAVAREEGVTRGLGLYLDGDTLVRDRQRQVATAVEMELVHHRLTPRETVDAFTDYVATRRVPLVRLGPVGMVALARRAAREGIRAVLSGEGADELFSGYDSYRILAAREGAFGPVADLPWDRFGPPEFGADRSRMWMRAYWRGLIAFSGTAADRRVDILRPVAGLFRPSLRDALLAPPPAAAIATGPGAAAPAGPPEAPRERSTLERRRAADLDGLLGSYLLTVQGDHAWMEEGVELRPPFLADPVARWALSRRPEEFVSIEHGKLPVRALLDRLAQSRPQLAGLGFGKAAFRVDCRFVLQDPEAFDDLATLVARCPDELMDTDALAHRVAACRSARTCSEAESMAFLFAASLGVLAHADDTAARLTSATRRAGFFPAFRRDG